MQILIEICGYKTRLVLGNWLYGTGTVQRSSVLLGGATVQTTEHLVAEAYLQTKAIQKEMDKHPGSTSTSWRIG